MTDRNHAFNYDPDTICALERRARQLRAEAFASGLRAIGRWLQRGLTALQRARSHQSV